jgi:hypothetical protein
MKINVDKTKYMNTSKYENKNMQPKVRPLITKNIKKYQNLNICIHWLLIAMIVEKCPSKNKSRESISSGSLKIMKSRYCIDQKHRTKNMHYND